MFDLICIFKYLAFKFTLLISKQNSNQLRLSSLSYLYINFKFYAIIIQFELRLTLRQFDINENCKIENDVVGRQGLPE